MVLLCRLNNVLDLVSGLLSLVPGIGVIWAVVL